MIYLFRSNPLDTLHPIHGVIPRTPPALVRLAALHQVHVGAIASLRPGVSGRRCHLLQTDGREGLHQKKSCPTRQGHVLLVAWLESTLYIETNVFHTFF